MHRRRLRALALLLAVLAATVLSAVAPAEAGGGCHAPATEGRGTAVALTDLCFTPTVLRVAPGAEVTFVNRDSIAHPLGRPGGEWGWDGNAGGRASVRLDEAGTYPFFCYVHPGMVGVVVVGDGRGTGAQVVQVDDPVPAAPAAPAAATGQPAARAGAGPTSFPAAWLVVVALAALAGGAAGARLAKREAS